MGNKEKFDHDIIDEDLYEEFDDEELYELVQEAKREALQRAREERINPKPRRPFPKWAFWLIAFTMAFNIVALIPQTFSIPAIDFLITSAQLSTQKEIKEYKKAVVVVETPDSRGTGFAYSRDGFLLTNAHVVKDEEIVTVAFPEEGLFQARVIESYPSIDLAILQTEFNGEQDFPYLNLAEEAIFETDENIYFIGNPLRFNGIANEGTILDYLKLSSWEEDVLMIKAPVYRGNSGSPVINEKGEVLGVVFATLKHNEYGKVGLFVPIDLFHTYHKDDIQ